MSEKSLSLPSCPYCRSFVECVVEDDVHRGFVGYTVRCRCYALTTHVTHEALAQGGEDYALDVAHQRWKEVVDKMHMVKVSDPANTKNPGSEETGVDSDAVWEAVVKAMRDAYDKGLQHKPFFAEEVLESYLNGVRESSDPPPEDHQW